MKCINLLFLIFVVLFPFRASSKTITYTYDTSGRVIEAALNYGVHILYSYDATGNRLQRNVVIDPPPGPGDVNSDGELTLSDAILSLQVQCNIQSEQPVFSASDISGNSQIDMAETIWILQTLSQ